MVFQKGHNGNGNGHVNKGGRPLSLATRTNVAVKERIAAVADHLINAELIEGLGSFVVMTKDDEGNMRRVTDEQEIIAFINAHHGAPFGTHDGKTYIISAKDGNYKCRQYLLDRGFGRPAQQIAIQPPPPLELEDLLEEVIARLMTEQGFDESEARRYVELARISKAKQITNGNGTNGTG